MTCATGLQAAPLYLGDGTQTTNPWDATTSNWLADTNSPGITQPWVDGSDAFFMGAGAKLQIALAGNFTADANDFIYVVGSGGLNINGDTNAVSALNINGTASTLPTKKFIEMRNVLLGGTFTVSNVNQFVYHSGSSAASNTAITVENARLTINNDIPDFSNLSVTLVAPSGNFRASSNTNRVVGSLSGTGELDAKGDVTLNNSAVGTSSAIGNINKIGVGNLTLGSGIHSFDVNRSGTTNTADQITGSDITAGGILEINILPGSDPLTVSNVFYLFTKEEALAGGSFTSNSLPALDTGLSWGTELLTTRGLIYVTDDTFVPGRPDEEVGNVLAYYSCDQHLQDLSGNGNNASFLNGGTYSTDSAFGSGSFSTDGGLGYINQDAEIAFLTTDNWTASFWYKAADAATPYGLGGNTQANSSLTLNLNAAADRTLEVRANHRSDKATFTSAATDPAVDSNVWHHIVVTATGDGNIVKVYEDGVEMTGTWTTDDDTAMLFDHWGNSGTGNALNGLIDEIYVMDWALTANQVNTLFASNIAPGMERDIPALPARIVDISAAPSNTLKIVIDIPEISESVPEKYVPKHKADLVFGGWSKFQHSDSFNGTFAKTNLSVAAAEGADLAIYVKAPLYLPHKGPPA
jgi:hypothetical protein